MNDKSRSMDHGWTVLFINLFFSYYYLGQKVHLNSTKFKRKEINIPQIKKITGIAFRSELIIHHYHYLNNSRSHQTWIQPFLNINLHEIKSIMTTKSLKIILLMLTKIRLCKFLTEFVFIGFWPKKYAKNRREEESQSLEITYFSKFFIQQNSGYKEYK